MFLPYSTGHRSEIRTVHLSTPVILWSSTWRRWVHGPKGFDVRFRVRVLVTMGLVLSDLLTRRRSVSGGTEVPLRSLWSGHLYCSGKRKKGKGSPTIRCRVSGVSAGTWDVRPLRGVPTTGRDPGGLEGPTGRDPDVTPS